MGTAEQDMIANYWQRCKARLNDAGPQGTAAILVAAENLLPEWCINDELMQQVLEHAVKQQELPAEILQCWQDRLEQRRASGAALRRSNRPAVEPVPEASLALVSLRQVAPTEVTAGTVDALPDFLLPYAQAIGQCSRKQGKVALQLGLELCRARKACDRDHRLFLEFLAYLRRQYGVHRGTCYLYMKYCEWELPEGLGSAVMKWIVQGFRRGSKEAKAVIRTAMEEGVTLAQLIARYGALRTRQPTESRGRQVVQVHAPRAILRLEKNKERLLAQRLDIERQLIEVESELTQLKTLAQSAMTSGQRRLA